MGNKYQTKEVFAMSFNFGNLSSTIVQLSGYLRIGFQSQEAGKAGQRFCVMKTELNL